MKFSVVKPTIKDRMQEKKDISKMLQAAKKDVAKLEKSLKETERDIAKIKKKK